MKCLIIIPPSSTIFTGAQTMGFLGEPLGPLYLGSMVKDLCDIYIIDAFSLGLNEDAVLER